MRWTTFVRAAVMLVAQSAALQSRLSAKAVVREKRKLDPKLPTGANEVEALPRRKDYEDAADPDSAWAQAVDDATDNFGRVVGRTLFIGITPPSHGRPMASARPPRVA